MNPGQKLRDRYQVIKSLQSGGMGTVFLAQDTALGDSLCAIKQMHNLDVDADQYLRARFEAEMLALVHLQHPGIPRVRDYFQEESSVFLVMDFIEGRSLAEEIQSRQQQPAPQKQAVEDMLQVLEVLDYMHSQNPPVLHRDIKPANLIREASSGKIKVVDFGLARSVELQGETSHTQVGTLGYSAIEQLSGQAQIRSDLYSVGATLHQLVTGLRPSLAGVEPLTPRNMNPYDPTLAQIIQRATQPEPKKRYASAREMAQALQRCLLPPSPQAAPAPSRRGRAYVLLAVLLLGLLFFTARQIQTSPPADTGLAGDIFAFRTGSNNAEVTLGEEVGLFRVKASANRTARQRSEILARRLNHLYHHRCGGCGNLTLEPQGIRVGRLQLQGLDEVVLFYAHLHGDQWIYGPELLATADAALAKRAQATPRSLAGYWRNLVRDVVNLSRGQSSWQSPLGPSFLPLLNQARAEQESGKSTIANLRAVLKRLPNGQAQQLQEAFLVVPQDFSFEADRFPEHLGYKPLTI